MIILAGIDEAGLGPTLGPLVTASAALEVPEEWRPGTPWERLESAFCREWRKGETRAGVADSKVLYRTGGLGALELTVGAFARLAGSASIPASGGNGRTKRHPCYSGRLEPFPAYTEADGMLAARGAIDAALTAAGARAVHLEAAPLFEPELNRRFESGLNKNEALLMETGRHLAALAEKFPGRRILVVVDKQGGRNDYLPFLTALFPGVWPREVVASARSSHYLLLRPGGTMEIYFDAKADRNSFATALASLAAKYVRERAMAELNAWFGERLPGLKATAGYPQDAERWLGEVRAGAGGAAEWELELLVRTR